MVKPMGPGQAGEKVSTPEVEPKAGIGVEFVYENEKTKGSGVGLVAKRKTQMIRELRVRVPKLTEHR